MSLTLFSSKNLLFTVTVSPLEKTADNSPSFIGARSALIERNYESFELFDLVAHPDAEFETAAGNDIKHGDVLGQADWVMKRQQQHTERNANPFGAGRDCGRHREHRRQIAIVDE